MNVFTHMLGIVVAAAMSSSSVIKSKGNFRLLIVHNNDMHARFDQTSQDSGVCTAADKQAGKCYGGFARIAHVVKEARHKAASGEGPPVLFLNAGDTYTGSAMFTVYKWKIATEFINALKPDAVCLGNHEFDNGVDGLTPYIHNLKSPVLSSNLDLTKVPELAAESNLKKSIVINKNGTLIGIIGYLTPTTKFEATKNDVEFYDEISEIRKEAKRLHDQGVNILIALGHSGYDKDLEIARTVDHIDLVIGAHTHTFLWNGTQPDSNIPSGPYPTYETEASGRSVPVVTAFAFTKYIGKIHLEFDSNGELVTLDGSPILLDKTIPQDNDIMNILEHYRQGVVNLSNEVEGNTLVTLDAISCGGMECNFGNMITDAMVYRYALQYKGEHWTDAPIAVMHAGGIRASITGTGRSTNITKEDLLTALPFHGPVTVVTMNGSIIYKMLEQASLNMHLSYTPEFLQVSGMKIIYDARKPAGSRVIVVKARCGLCNIPKYDKIEEHETYKVIMPSFIANGGNEYVMFNELLNEVMYFDELECTQYYVQQHSPVIPEVEERITILN